MDDRLTQSRSFYILNTVLSITLVERYFHSMFQRLTEIFVGTHSFPFFLGTYISTALYKHPFKFINMEGGKDFPIREFLGYHSYSFPCTQWSTRLALCPSYYDMSTAVLRTCRESSISFSRLRIIPEINTDN